MYSHVKKKVKLEFDQNTLSTAAIGTGNALVFRFELPLAALLLDQSAAGQSKRFRIHISVSDI